MNCFGRCYWITGLPAAGKTTLGRALVLALQSFGQQAILLDGDELRAGLCADLGLSTAEHSENIRRTGEVAHLLALNAVIPGCALVSPFIADRQRVRERFPFGHFKEIYLSMPLNICQQRDPKQLRRGELRDLTGVDAPYEAPISPELRFDTSLLSVEQLISEIHC